MPTLRKVQRYGWIKDRPDSRDLFMAFRPEDLRVLPPDVDLVNDNMPAVEDQLDLGACTSFGSLAAAEYERRKDKAASGDFVPSHLFQYYNTRRIEGTTTEDSGGSIRDAVKSMAHYGLLHEDQWPYDIKKFAIEPTHTMYGTAKKCLLQRYAKVPQSLVYIRSTLARGYPIILGFNVYESFESDAVAKTGLVPMPDISREAVVGGHCVLCVGYNFERRLFKMRNSWGAGWGANGYFWFPFEYLVDRNLSDDFWMVDTISS